MTRHKPETPATTNTVALRTALRVWLSDIPDVWRAADIEEHIRERCAASGFDFPFACMTLRLCLTGQKSTPPIFEMADIIGYDETLARIDATLPTSTLDQVQGKGEAWKERPAREDFLKMMW